MNASISRPGRTRAWFFAVARLEGLSLLALLFVAMPLKYVAGDPRAVEWVGLVHGLLFLVYVLALAIVVRAEGWSIARAALGFVASMVPGGTFLFERSVAREMP